MKNLIFVVIVSMFLMSCGHHRDGTSVWAERLWLVPLLPAIGAIIWFIAAYRSSKGGSNPIDPSGKILRDKEAGNVPIWKIPFFKYAVGCLIAVIVIIIMVNSDK